MSGCPRPDKAAYPSRREAYAAMTKIPRRKRIGLQPYRCRGGCNRWHLGRLIRRATVAWRSVP